MDTYSVEVGAKGDFLVWATMPGGKSQVVGNFVSVKEADDFVDIEIKIARRFTKPLGVV